MKILRSIRNRFMMFKQYISRTVTYLSIINSGMILFLFLSKLKERDVIQADLDKYFFIIFVTGLITLLIIGWFDIKYLKAMQEENTINFNLQPPMVEMKQKIDEMYDEFKKNEKTKM